jgi:D-glycero-D-manno-heptose 1,7-bisphosphate phosphatase
VFLDRDGVLTEPIWNPATGDYESPHQVGDVRLYPDVAAALRTLQTHGFALFIVTNQPSYAKGKVDLQTLEEIGASVDRALHEAGVRVWATYCCFHHPTGTVAGYSRPCLCRKPEPYFLLQAARDYNLDLPRSWMVGDRDSDVECGRRAGCRTVLIANPLSQNHQGTSRPDHVAADLDQAVEVIAHATSVHRRALSQID